jgi:hypothetical protein
MGEIHTEALSCCPADKEWYFILQKGREKGSQKEKKKGKERRGKERKGKERKGKERKGKERKGDRQIEERRQEEPHIKL